MNNQEAIIAIMTKIAKCDDRISTDEAKIISNKITKLVNIAKEENDIFNEYKYRESLVNFSKIAKDSASSVSYYTNYINSDFKETILLDFIKIASVNGISLKQEALIFEIGNKFNFSERETREYLTDILGKNYQYSRNKEYYERKQNKPKTDSDFNHYKLLNCHVSDDNETIKINYRKSVKKFHPDIIQGKDLDEEFIKFANKKMREINLAYEKIRKERNF